MKRLLIVAALLPLIAATAVAGIVSNPDDVRPCVEEFTEGITGRPTHMVLGADGDLYAAEEEEKKILRFDPDTHVAREYAVPVTPHDLTQGPDGRIWFVSAPAFVPNGRDTGQNKLAALNPDSGEVQTYPGISRGAEPHALRWVKGRLYITEFAAEGLAIFDPNTEEIREDDFGVPAASNIHNIAPLPNGDLWAVLQGPKGNALARFSFEKQRFDKFVRIPIAESGPRDITYVRQRNALYATLFAANKLAEYDLDVGRLVLHDVGVDAISYKTALGRGQEPKLTFVRPNAKGDAVFIATLAGGEILRFDLDSHEVKGIGCGVAVPSGPLGIATDGKGRLWYTTLFPRGKLSRVEE